MKILLMLFIIAGTAGAIFWGAVTGLYFITLPALVIAGVSLEALSHE